MQVNALIYHMGDQADDILLSFRLDDEEKKKYDTVKGKFEEHFIKRHNPIYKRAKFNQRKQLPGESVDDFITSLYGRVEHCNYNELRDEMIRDRIVVGLTDATLAERLQLDPDLTLETAITKARQSEEVKKQQSVVRGDTPRIDAVRNKKTQKRPATNKQEPCTRCGKTPFTQDRNVLRKM